MIFLRKITFLIVIGCYSTVIFSQDKTEMLNVDNGLEVAVGTWEPKQEFKGNILYVPGFADAFSLHGTYFQSLAKQGYRVIGFDYPSHGQTQNNLRQSLDFHSIPSLAKIAKRVLQKYDNHVDGPNFLMGWSTGGLVLSRGLQLGYFSDISVDGLVLISPGFAVKPLPGQWGFVTAETLTHDTDRITDIQPKSPLFKPVFALNLLYHNFAVRRSPVPQVPTLVLSGTEKDAYVSSRGIQAWVDRQIQTYKHPRMFHFEFPLALHGIHLEDEAHGGKKARGLMLKFFNNVSEMGIFDPLSETVQGLCEQSMRPKH